MAYGDLQTFLPRAEGEVLDVERAKTEANARANYLSSMDQFYEQLEESARQFDIAQALAERQFEWQSGFEEKRLAQEKELTKEKLDIERQVAESQSRWYDTQGELGRGELEISRNQLDLATREQSFLQDYYRDQFRLEEKRFGLEEKLANQSIYGSGGGVPMYDARGKLRGYSATGSVYDIQTGVSGPRYSVGSVSSSRSSGSSIYNAPTLSESGSGLTRFESGKAYTFSGR